MPTDLRSLIAATRRIAVIGYSSQPSKAGSYVPEYLRRHGFEIIAVNPRLQPREGLAVVARLEDLPTPVDMVLIFRQSEKVPEHLAAILALQPSPQVVWMQLGIRSPEARRALESAGIAVVSDRCLKVEHAASFGGES